MKTKIITKSLLPALKKVAITGTVILLSSAASVHAEFEIKTKDFEFYQSQARASHFLSQATMGANHDEIKALGARMRSIGYYEACEEWIDDQFAMPRGTRMLDQANAMVAADNAGDGTGASFYWSRTVFDQAVHEPDQLRQRMAFSLSQIFVVSVKWWNGIVSGNRWHPHTAYYDKLMDESFGNHRDLLQTITYDPFMGAYLSFAQNSKGDPDNGIFPDQNYAREVMQLFSCGVFTLDLKGNILMSNGVPLENYDEDDIFEIAQVFTGLSLKKGNTLDPFLTTPINQFYMEQPMQMVDFHHDTSTKILLDGSVLPANQKGFEDINDTLDHLSEHDSTAPHLSVRLIKRLTSSNPSVNYTRAVSLAWRNSGGDFKEVLKEILLHPEAREAVTYSITNVSGNKGIFTATTKDPLTGRVKEPLLMMTQFYTLCNATSDRPDGRIRLSRFAMAADVQEALGANSVFNFYSNEYAPATGPIGDYRAQTNVDFVSPEMEILSRDVISQFELLYGIATTLNPGANEHGNSVTTLPGLEALLGRYSFTKSFVLNLDIVLCGGQMPYSVATSLTSILDSTGKTREEKTAELTALIINSADANISR